MANDYGCSPKLFYGEQLFSQIEEFDNNIWTETLDYLELWKNSLPDMPEINFDNNANDVFEEIKDLQPSTFRKLFENTEIIQQIFPIIFPNNTVLKLLYNYFISRTDFIIYQTLATQIAKFI